MLNFLLQFHADIEPISHTWPPNMQRAFAFLYRLASQKEFEKNDQTLNEMSGPLHTLSEGLLVLPYVDSPPDSALKRFTCFCLIAEAKTQFILGRKVAALRLSLTQQYLAQSATIQNANSAHSLKLLREQLSASKHSVSFTFNLIIKCIGIVEHAYLPTLIQDREISSLIAELSNQYAKWYYRFTLDHRAFPSKWHRLFAQDFEKIIATKNARHQKQGGNFNGKVIYTPEVTTFTRIDPASVAPLLQLIDSIYRRESQRTQVLFFVNTSFSHCMALDIGLDSSGHLHILVFEPAAQHLQFELLRILELALITRGYRSHITACQSRLQNSAALCDSFSLLFLSESAKHALETTTQRLSPQAQPHFFNSFISDKMEMPPLNHTKWFHVAELAWPKLMLSRQSFSQLEIDLKDLEQRLGKIKLGDNPDYLSAKQLHTTHESTFKDKDGFNSFMQRKAQKHYRALTNPLPCLPLDTLCAQYRKPKATATPTPGQALRLAAAGFQSKQFMQQLIDYLSSPGSDTSSLDEKDTNPLKGKTALHWALSEKNATRAAMLVVAGAKGDIKDVSGVTACQLYQKSADYALCHNHVLMRKFKAE